MAQSSRTVALSYGGCNHHSSLAAKAATRHHHCRVLPSPLPHGRRAEDLHRAGRGGLREVSAGARGGALPARSGFPFCPGVVSLAHIHTCQHCRCWSTVGGGGEVSTPGHFPRGFPPSRSSAHLQVPSGPWRALLPSLLEMIVSWANVSKQPFLSDDPLSERVASLVQPFSLPGFPGSGIGQQPAAGTVPRQ